MAVKAKKSEQFEHIPSYLDMLAPQALYFGQRDMVLNDRFATTLTITAYPNEVGQAWLSNIATMSNVIMNMHITQQEPIKLIDELNKSMSTLQNTLQFSSHHQTISRTEAQIKAVQLLFNKIEHEQQKVINLVVNILITANTIQELNNKRKEVEARVAGKSMRARVTPLLLEDAFRSILPFGEMSSKIFQLGRQNMPIETFAASFPFVYSGLNDGRGILFGKDTHGGIVLFDLWKREGSRTNSNFTVLGKPGMGKTTAIKKIITDEYARGTKIILIDPERENKELCENLNGQWINASGSRDSYINPFQIRIVAEDEEEEEEKFYDTSKGTSALALHFQTLRAFFDLYIKDMSRKQQAMLEVAIEKTYESKNIFWDTDPRTLKNTDYPIMEDLYRWLSAESEKTESQDWFELSLMMRSAAIGADQTLWNGHTNIEAKAQFVVLDINDLLEGDERIRMTQFFNVLGWAWDQVSQDREERVLLVTDETYLLVDPDNPRPLMFLRNTSKRIRKYGGGLMVITHNMNDFMDPSVRRYGQALLDNPAYKIIMSQGDNDIKSLTTLMSLSDEEIRLMKKGTRGMALFVAGDRRLQVKIEVSPYQLQLFGKGGGK